MTMTKTVKDYMNDPRILHDRGVMEAPRCIREIHAIRLKIQDETKTMTPEELADYYRKSRELVDAECARLGFKVQYVNSSSS
ncbi:hypothetical protein LQZ21_08775 [Treponema sp. TIM-1]|uniref:hypothetical protein n=1 Tax=Treponema sp. TIM-1 TaxID=2898417 RepID=UPI00397F3F45